MPVSMLTCPGYKVETWDFPKPSPERAREKVERLNSTGASKLAIKAAKEGLARAERELIEWDEVHRTPDPIRGIGFSLQD